jgi:hypothetical protein
MRHGERPPSDPGVPTLFDVVHRAVSVVDPAGDQEGPSQLLARFENRDEPVTAFEDVPTLIAEQKGAIDPQDEDPPVVMAAALATYLAFRRDEMDDDPDELLRLAARAEFDGNPPDAVRGWLSERGVEI